MTRLIIESVDVTNWRKARRAECLNHSAVLHDVERMQGARQLRDPIRSTLGPSSPSDRTVSTLLITGGDYTGTTVISPQVTNRLNSRDFVSLGTHSS